MTRILRFGKRIALAALVAGILLVAAQVVFAEPPIADFTAAVDATLPATGCRSVTFTSNATDPENDALTIQWDFDNDGTFDDSGSTPAAHVFDSAGTHQVTMRATSALDPLEFTDVTKPVDIPNALPTASFTDAYVAATGVTNFASTATDDDGTIAGWAWDFGDGTANTATVPHQFTAHSQRPVSLTVTDNCGGIATASRNITPGNTAPVVPAPTATAGGQALPAANAAVNPGVPVTFAVAPTDANGDAFTYAWDLDGDGQFDDSTAASPTVPSYAATTQPVNVSVRVNDTVVNADSPAFALRINQAPVARFTNNPESPRVGESVQFNALAPSGPSADPDGTIAKYEWDFDGTNNWVEGTANPTHVYTVAKKDVNVGLRVTDNNGVVSVAVRKQIDVNSTRPTAALRAEPANPLPGQTVTLTSTSSKDPQSWALPITVTEWDFAYVPGVFTANARGSKATTSFATAGVHTVGVRVFDGSGGDDTAYLPIVVNARPKASFTVRPSKPREGTEVTFISTSGDPDGPIARQEWDLDNDGRYDDAQGVVAATKKLKKGTRTVRLRVTDSKGATDTSAQQVKVTAKPPAGAPQVIKTLGYAPRSWGIQVVALYVTVPARTTVKVTCKGRGCPRGTFVKRSGKKGTQLRFKKFRGLLRAGAKITVISYRSGSMAEYFTYTVRGKHRGPLKRKRCKALGAKKYGACG